VQTKQTTYIKEVELVDSTANAGCEKEGIPLQPRDLDGRVLEANSWIGHY